MISSLVQLSGKLISKNLPFLGKMVAGEKGEQFVNKITSFLGCNPNEITDKLDNPEIIKALLEFQNTELDLHIKNTINARNYNLGLNQSKNASWLTKNIVALQTILWTSLWATISIAILFIPIKVSEAASMSILQQLTGFIMLILGYWFGSADGDNLSEKLSNTLKKAKSKLTK